MNHFNVKANEKERSFFRKFGKHGYQLLTGLGKLNMIQSVTSKSVLVTSETGNEPFRVSRKRIREAVAFLLYKRTVTREDLETFSKGHNSCLLAILRSIFIEISRVQKTTKGLLRLSLKGLRFMFSGLSCTRMDVKTVKENGGQFALLSYHNLRFDKNDRWKSLFQSLSMHFSVDSGEYSRFNAVSKGKHFEPISVRAYGEFLKKHLDSIYQFFNLDFIGDMHKSRYNQRFLEDYVGKRPIPIWHIMSPLHELEAIVKEDHELIAIGGIKFIHHTVRKQRLDEVFKAFPAENFHGLCVGNRHLLDYEFFSADSTNWLNGRRFGELVTLDKNVRAPQHWTSEESLGFNIRLLSSLEERYNGMQVDLSMLAPDMG